MAYDSNILIETGQNNTVVDEIILKLQRLDILEEENKKLKSDVQDVKKKYTELKQEHSQLKLKNKEAKEKNYNQSLLIKTLSEEVDSLRKSNKEIIKNAAKTKKEFCRDKLFGDFKNLSRQYSKLVNNNLKLRKENLLLTDYSNRLAAELQLKSEFDGSAELTKLEQKHQQVVKDLQIHIDRNRVLREALAKVDLFNEGYSHIPEVLSVIYSLMNHEDIEMFAFIKDMYDKYCALNSMTTQKKLKSEDLIETVTSIEVPNKGVESFGYVISNEAGRRFVDLNSNTYNIEFEDDFIFYNNMPVKALIKDDTAYILDTYAANHLITKKNLIKQKSVSSTNVVVIDKLSMDDTYYGNFRVLIIGSLNKTQYIYALKRHGIKVDWYDPYEKSTVHLMDRFKSADIVLVCKGHIPHSAVFCIDINHEKVEQIDRKCDNKETIVARTRFAAIRLGLLQLGDQNYNNTEKAVILS